MSKLFSCCILLFSLQFSHAQDVALYTQFNGRYDYSAIGNTMNIEENGPGNLCAILTASSAELILNSDQIVTAAYLYWAGSGTGDFDVTLNGNPITAERTFSDALDENRIFFAAFADVTTLVETTGNGIYTLSDLDLTAVIPPYCPTGTNFAGWVITIIYEDSALPLNQLNVYDGLQSVPTELTIVLNNLNVLDNEDAKIGFVAWEGDAALAVDETLTINGNVISNPPLNPANNAFNGTNSFTNTSGLHNMDIDVYSIQDNIAIGDTSATIQLTSGQDFVMINNIITVLNSQLPDATVVIDEFSVDCNTADLTVLYEVFNTNSTDTLPANTPIAFYIDDTLIGLSSTQNPIAIGASESGSIVLPIPENSPGEFNLTVVVDDNGTGTGTVTEINEQNNADAQLVTQLLIAPVIALTPLQECDEGFNSALFDLTATLNEIPNTFDITQAMFFEGLDDAAENQNAITNPSAFENTMDPQSIYIRIDDAPCYQLFSFSLQVDNCPPVVPQGFSPNGDGFNDWFNIQGLYDVFEQHELLIYNRYGTLIFQGNNNNRWFGKANKGLNAKGSLVPVGTYFYVLHLNDPDFNSLSGWVYVNY